MSNFETTAGFSVDGTEVKLYHLKNEAGLELVVTNLGAAAVSIFLGDQSGRMDVLLGFEKLEKQLEKGPMFGVTLGRYAGKILGASYEWEGKNYPLSKSHGENHAHGGVRGFDKRVFQTLAAEETKVVFAYVSPDGQEGYPGTLRLQVAYELCGRDIKIQYSAVADQDTPVGISNHMYFNLLGNGKGEVTDHEVSIRSDRVAVLDEKGLPAGKVCFVEGTVMDLRTPGRIGDCLKRPADLMKPVGGFDHDYILSGNPKDPAVTLYEPETGRGLKLYTDMPCVHFYVPDFSGMDYIGKARAVYRGRDGVAMEPMYVCDCLHNGIGPSPIRKAGENWGSETRLCFTW